MAATIVAHSHMKPRHAQLVASGIKSAGAHFDRAICGFDDCQEIRTITVDLMLGFATLLQHVFIVSS
jgi:hypothetical protein